MHRLVSTMKCHVVHDALIKGPHDAWRIYKHIRLITSLARLVASMTFETCYHVDRTNLWCRNCIVVDFRHMAILSFMMHKWHLTPWCKDHCNHDASIYVIHGLCDHDGPPAVVPIVWSVKSGDMRIASWHDHHNRCRVDVLIMRLTCNCIIVLVDRIRHHDVRHMASSMGSHHHNLPILPHMAYGIAAVITLSWSVTYVNSHDDRGFKDGLYHLWYTGCITRDRSILWSQYGDYNIHGYGGSYFPWCMRNIQVHIQCTGYHWSHRCSRCKKNRRDHEKWIMWLWHTHGLAAHQSHSLRIVQSWHVNCIIVKTILLYGPITPMHRLHHHHSCTLILTISGIAQVMSGTWIAWSVTQSRHS